MCVCSKVHLVYENQNENIYIASQVKKSICTLINGTQLYFS